MACHVIQDSDDEGSDLSPAKSPVAPAPVRDALGKPVGQPDASPAPSRSGSTDPSFFQRIYDEHNQNASTEISRQRQADNGLSFESGHVDTPQHTRSSLTDPNMAKVPYSKKAHVSNTEQSSAYTQVTSPGRPARQSEKDIDIWDIPNSPEANIPGRRSVRKGDSASVTKVYGKRRRISQQSVGLDDDRYAAVEPPSPATPVAKRARHDDQAFLIGATTMNSLVTMKIPTTMNQVGSTTMSALTKPMAAVGKYVSHQVPALSEALDPDSVSLITIPVSDDMGHHNLVNTKRTRDHSSGLVTETQLADTQKDTRIEVNLTQALSSSEKQAYRIFNLSGDSDATEAVDSSSLALPVPQKDGRRDLSRSSGDVTEAVATPSAYAACSTRRTAESSDLPSTEIPMPPPSTSSARGRKRKSIALPTSSPDIISGTSTRSAKKRKFARADDDELIGHSPSGPRSSRLRSSALESLPDTQPPPGGFQLPYLQDNPTPVDNAANLPVAEENMSMPETGQSLDPILISSGQEAPQVEPIVAQKPLVKTQKKRGRKKKEALKPPEVSPGLVKSEEPRSEPTVDIDGDTAFVPNDKQIQTLQPTETPEAKPKRKRGRPKKFLAKVDNGSNNAPAATIENHSPEVEASANETTRPLRDGSGTNKNTDKQPERQQTKESSEPNDARANENTSDDFSRGKSEVEEKLPVIGAVQVNMQTSKIDDESKDEQPVKPLVSAEPTNKEAVSCNRNGSQVVKATYRVGLSKRSRIAPLLKSLRK